MLRWSDLTDEEKKGVSNGCGSKGFIVPIPNFTFKASCDQHDFYYWRGGNGKLRARVDKDFLDAMLDDSKTYWHKVWAYTYYRGVRLGRFLDYFKPHDKKFWYYTETPRGKRQLNYYLKRKTVT